MPAESLVPPELMFGGVALILTAFLAGHYLSEYLEEDDEEDESGGDEEGSEEDS